MVPSVSFWGISQLSVRACNPKSSEKVLDVVLILIAVEKSLAKGARIQSRVIIILKRVLEEISAEQLCSISITEKEFLSRVLAMT